MRIVACPDKFRGTAAAAQIAQTVAQACATLRRSGTLDAQVIELPVADGGEGTLDAFGGPNQWSTVTGPMLAPTSAAWRLDDGLAVIEMAQASGLLLAGGAAGNDPLAATTAGTGELLVEAVRRGATRIIVGVGGSATTDGGLGALEAMSPLEQMSGVEIVVACDVRTRFCDAANVFGPQKGASRAQTELLTRRLVLLAAQYAQRYGVDVRDLDGAGAAGGLAGGLAAGIGAQLVSGFDVVAAEIGLAEAVSSAAAVVTGEGRLDAGSFHGKAVGGVVGLAAAAAVPVIVVVGARADGIELPDHAPAGSRLVVLTERFGDRAALNDTVSCVRAALVDVFADLFGSATADTSSGADDRHARRSDAR